MFKNEYHVIKEFIEHYIQQGVDNFLMIDNNSDDNYYEILKPYIDNKIVDLISDSNKHSQVMCINNNFLEKSKIYDWVIVCDLDEFIYARKKYKNIKEYLISLDESVSQVFIPWKMFGSNGYNTIEKEQPDNLFKTFTKRTNYDKKNGFQGVIQSENKNYSYTKSIVKTKYLTEFGIHSHKTLNNNYISSDNNNNSLLNNQYESNFCFSLISEDILENSFLHLNHYAIQSLNWFMKIKATRGDVYSYSNENVRNENYFHYYDICSNDIIDEELYNIKKNIF
jgi:hypothetical protein